MTTMETDAAQHAVRKSRTRRRPVLESPHPVDIHVGAMIRTARGVAGLSQTKLADAIGVTFQQMQKYEKAVNRVSASKLWEIATLLDVDISYFFGGLTQETLDKVGAITGYEYSAPANASGTPSPLSADALKVAMALDHVGDAAVRRKIRDLVLSVAGLHGDG